MRKWDILVVRFLPFALFVIFGLNVISAFRGGNGFIPYEIHGNSAVYALGLFLISLANNRYHCIWNRAMYIFLILVPLFNYLEATFCFSPSWDAYVYVVSIMYGITALVTAYLAIRHFVKTIMKKYYARINQRTNTNNERGNPSPKVSD